MRGALLLLAMLGGCATAAPPAVDRRPVADARPAQVVVSAHLPSPLSASRLVVHLDDGARAWVVRGGDLAHASGNVWRGEPQATANSGTLAVRYVLTAPDASVVSEGRIELPLRPDWVVGIDVHAATEDPRRYCMGCLGSVRFPLAAQAQSPAADAVYLVWGGNSISSPVVY